MSSTYLNPFSLEIAHTKHLPKPVLKGFPWQHYRSGLSTAGNQTQNGSSKWRKHVNLSKQSAVTLVDWLKHIIFLDRFVGGTSVKSELTSKEHIHSPL